MNNTVTMSIEAIIFSYILSLSPLRSMHHVLIGVWVGKKKTGA